MATLQEQIAQKWGQYGDWNAAGQNQTDALAKLLQANGVEDLSQFQLKARDFETAAEEQETPNGVLTTPGRKGTAFDAFYGDKQLGFLGDINRDGSFERKDKEQTVDKDYLGKMGGEGERLGWS